MTNQRLSLTFKRNIFLIYILAYAPLKQLINYLGRKGIMTNQPLTHLSRYNMLKSLSRNDIDMMT